MNRYDVEVQKMQSRCNLVATDQQFDEEIISKTKRLNDQKLDEQICNLDAI